MQSLLGSVRPRWCSLAQQPVRHGRYMMPGALHLPFHERFDVNTGDRLPRPHPETPRYRQSSGTAGPPARGPAIAKTKPFRFEAKAGKVYWWCSCGLSHTQPLCDGHHKRANKLQDAGHYVVNFPNFRPLKLQLEEDKEVWLCQCKRTKNPPYCDGSHRAPDVQEAKEL